MLNIVLGFLLISSLFSNDMTNCRKVGEINISEISVTSVNNPSNIDLAPLYSLYVCLELPKQFKTRKHTNLSIFNFTDPKNISNHSKIINNIT